MKYNQSINQWIQVPAERNLLRVATSKKLTNNEMFGYKDTTQIREHLFFELMDELRNSNKIEHKYHVQPGVTRREDQHIFTAQLNLVNQLHLPTFVNERIFICNGKHFTEEEVAQAIKETFPERLI